MITVAEGSDHVTDISNDKTIKLLPRGQFVGSFNQPKCKKSKLWAMIAAKLNLKVGKHVTVVTGKYSDREW